MSLPNIEDCATVWSPLGTNKANLAWQPVIIYPQLCGKANLLPKVSTKQFQTGLSPR